jgi:hypothetical protein
MREDWYNTWNQEHWRRLSRPVVRSEKPSISQGRRVVGQDGVWGTLHRGALAILEESQGAIIEKPECVRCQPFSPLSTTRRADVASVSATTRLPLIHGGSEYPRQTAKSLDEG